jgi:hypothetical protein
VIDRGARGLAADAAILCAFFLFYVGSFELRSPINGPHEVFGQDTTHILHSLAEGKTYPWNAPSHLLYHHVVEHGYRLWQLAYGPGLESAYRYLELFSALCGAGFLAGMAWLFRELGLRSAPRAALLALAGVSLSSWFHFAAFETHALAMPALALYLVALARLRNRAEAGLETHLLLVVSLLVCGWTRVDLFRLAVASAGLLLLPRLRQKRRALAADLALVALLGVAGSTWLAHTYLDVPLREAVTLLLERRERPMLGEQLGRIDNLGARELVRVGRAVSLYSVLMPIEKRDPGRSFFAPPTYRLDPTYRGRGVPPSSLLFHAPARNLLRTALSAVACVGLCGALLWAGAAGLRAAAGGDVLASTVLLQAVTGWLLYTWFNPREPFLWVAEFMPLWVVLLADGLRSRPAIQGIGYGLLAVAVFLHNGFAFYLPFR